jgi:alginate O-acetyltransferase complex protein AlgI
VAGRFWQGRNVRLLAGWAILFVSLGLLLAVRNRFEAWIWMWFVGFALFFGLKLLTLLRLDSASFGEFSPSRLSAYLLLWPGLCPRPFLDVAGLPIRSRHLWLNGCIHLAAGSLAIWGMPRWLPVESPSWLFAWFGMVGFSLTVHFGLFDLLAAFWRSRGIPVEKLFCNPWRSVSLTDFWSHRWNRSFSGFARDLLFWPLARRWGARWATLAVFIFSGFVHELMISFPACGGYGGPFCYFLINGVCVCLETSRAWRSLAAHVPGLGRVWTLAGVLIPLPLLFHEPFQHRVVLPFLNVLGASGLP